MPSTGAFWWMYNKLYPCPKLRNIRFKFGTRPEKSMKLALAGSPEHASISELRGYNIRQWRSGTRFYLFVSIFATKVSNQQKSRVYLVGARSGIGWTV